MKAPAKTELRMNGVVSTTNCYCDSELKNFNLGERKAASIQILIGIMQYESFKPWAGISLQMACCDVIKEKFSSFE